jgi:hypothetical protein
LAVIFAKLKEWNYELNYSDGLSWHDLHTKFMKTGKVVEEILRFWLSKLKGYVMLVLLIELIIKCAVEIGSGGMIYM